MKFAKRLFINLFGISIGLHVRNASVNLSQRCRYGRFEVPPSILKAYHITSLHKAKDGKFISI